jgi:thioredoxin reductase (NADPH)
MEEALHLARFASRVVVVHRRDKLRASGAMQSRVLTHPTIDVLLRRTVVKLDGDAQLQRATLRDEQTEEETEFPVAGLFYAIGHTPNTDFLGGQLALTPAGYICTEPGRCTTRVHGVFAAGDVQDSRYRQAITAAGSGCMAALESSEYLADLESRAE